MVSTGPMPAILGELEQLLMLTVLRLGDHAHSVAVRQDLKERTGRDVSPGAAGMTGIAAALGLISGLGSGIACRLLTRTQTETPAP